MTSRIEFFPGPPCSDDVGAPAPMSAGLGWSLTHVDDDRIEVRLEGTLDAMTSVHVADAIAVELGGHPRTLTLDVRGLDFCTHPARDALEELLGPFRAEIAKIELVGGKAMGQMGLALLARRLRVPFEKRDQSFDAGVAV